MNVVAVLRGRNQSVFINLRDRYGIDLHVVGQKHKSIVVESSA